MRKVKVPKDDFLQFRIDTPTLARFRTAARAQGVSMSELLRRAIAGSLGGQAGGMPGQGEKPARPLGQ